MEENKDNKEKNNNKKWFMILIPLILILSIFLFSENNRNRTLDFLDSLANGEKELLLINSFGNDDFLDINIYDNTLVLWKENKISFMDIGGEIISEKKFDFTEASIYYGEDRIYAFDKSSGDIYFLEKDGETFSKVSLEKEIFNIKEKNGKLLCHSKAEGKEILDILDKDRVAIGIIDFKEKSILSYDINKRGTNILVSALNLNENKLKSQVYNYTENSEELGSIEIEEEIVLFNQLVDTSGEVILTDKALYYVRNSGVIWERQFNLIKDIYLEDEIYILHGNYLEAIDFKGETISKIGFTENYNNIINFNKSTLVYGEENLGLVKNGELLLEHKEPILKVYTSRKDIVILGPEIINIYEVNNKE